MSTNNQIDLVEFPAASAEELNAMTKFFTAVFGWEFKEWGEDYSDTHDSGVTAGVNGTSTKEQTMPLTVIYADDLEATKDKVVGAGGGSRLRIRRAISWRCGRIIKGRLTWSRPADMVIGGARGGY